MRRNSRPAHRWASTSRRGKARSWVSIGAVLCALVALLVPASLTRHNASAAESVIDGKRYTDTVTWELNS